MWLNTQHQPFLGEYRSRLPAKRALTQFILGQRELNLEELNCGLLTACGYSVIDSNIVFQGLQEGSRRQT